MAKRKQRTQTPLQSEDELRAVQIVEYEITSEPIHDHRYKRLPRYVKNAIDRLYYEAQKRPHKAIPELVDLIEKYPIMTFSNR